MKTIAEIGSNWDTIDLLDPILNEVDYVKFQIWDTERFIHPTHPGWARFKRYEVPDQMRVDLVHRFGPRLMASVFDEATAETMHDLGLTNWKIASGDLTHLRLIKYIARFNQRMWISTGNANEYEIKRAISTIREVNNQPLVVMHCVSRYPHGLSDLGLDRVKWLLELAGGRLDAPGSVSIGWSSHVEPKQAATAAAVMTALGVSTHEFHVGGKQSPDSVVSLTPKQLAMAIHTIRTIEGANETTINRDELLWARRNESDWLRPWIR